MKTHHSRQVGALTREFQHQMAAEAVADRGHIGGVRLRLRE